MRVIVQRSKNSKVSVGGKLVSKIDKGLVLLVGFTENDTEEDLFYLVHKILHLRIFDDENGIMNRSVIDIQGSILSISQFTLFADTKKGNRPSYKKALNGKEANLLYEKFNDELAKYIEVKTGIFGADMFLEIENDGPVTIIFDSKIRDL